eukprot:398344-Ditylum_brightwellii.AAC.1
MVQKCILVAVVTSRIRQEWYIEINDNHQITNGISFSTGGLIFHLCIGTCSVVEAVFRGFNTFCCEACNTQTDAYRTITGDGRLEFLAAACETIALCVDDK